MGVPELLIVMVFGPLLVGVFVVLAARAHSANRRDDVAAELEDRWPC